jgi:two-component sensor histidine kinase
MVIKAERLTVSIPSQINEYRLFIERSCDFVRDIPALSNDYSKVAKFKLVIMELLTNSIKHCRQESYLVIEKSLDEIVVKKIDNGPRFSFTDFYTNKKYILPLTDEEVDREINALLANNNKMLLKIRNKNSIEFLAPEEIIYQSIFEIPEHFGLLIIRQCADSLYYHYNAKLEENIFEVSFKL